MHEASATIKNVRPFSWVPQKIGQDPTFSLWSQKTWDSISIEVGCGAGLHPIQWSQQNPKSGLVAIERTKNKYQAFAQRLKSHTCNNVFASNTDALDWLPLHIKENSIDAYYFLYPNPYPKEKQANKRWHRAPIFEFILKTLKPGGLIHVASNETFYIEECLLYCEQFWKLSLHKKNKLNDNPAFKPRTHFEKKYLERGKTCYNLSFCKA